MDFDDDDDQNHDNQNNDAVLLQQTIGRLENWYNDVIPPAQQLSMQVYDNHQAMVNDPQINPNNLISFFLRMFELQMTPNYIIQFQDGEGIHTGIEALGRAHAAYASRVIDLQIQLCRYDQECPLLGDVDQIRSQDHHDHPATDANNIMQFHRLHGLGESGIRHLLTFSSSMNLIDNQMFGMGLQSEGEYNWLTMQSTYFRQYGKSLTNPQMVELYIGNLLIHEHLRISGEWIYEPTLVQQQRPIVWYNEELDKREYICEVCGRPESEHKYVEKMDNDGKPIYRLLLSNERTKHAFKRMVRPLEGSPKRFTGTYKRVCSVEEYVRKKTSQRVHYKMWLLRTQCTVSTIVENLKKSQYGDVPLHNTFAARAYNDGQVNFKDKRFYPNTCQCHYFMSQDAVGYEIDTLENHGFMRAGAFHANRDVIPEYVADNNAPTRCPCCHASPQPFTESATMYHDVYLDHPVMVSNMAGDYHPDYLRCEQLWTSDIVREYTKDMTNEVLAQVLPEDTSVEAIETFNTEDEWRERVIDTCTRSIEVLENIIQTMDTTFFDRVNDRFLEHDNIERYLCTECNKYIDHPDHEMECMYRPGTANFHVCETCGNPADHPCHLPKKCRAHVRAPIFENMVYNKEDKCFRCENDYANCCCPGKWGFFPYLMKAGAEENIETAFDTIFLNHVQEIPNEAYNFVVAMMGRTIGEYVGTDTDNIQGCVLIHGPKRTGKSEFLIAFKEMFPTDKHGDIPDSAEEQWWSAHLVDPVTNKTVKLVTCMELSHKCKVPMTEWQKMCDGGELTIHAKFITSRTVNVDFMAWFASNYLPFTGAMSRRSISVYLKHSIPEEFLDSTLRERMINDTAKQQYKAICAYMNLVAKFKRPVLNQVWPLYFKRAMEEMDRTSQPICAFLQDLPNCTRGGWHVVGWNTPELRQQRSQNYVPISKLQSYFNRWCQRNGYSSKWDTISWNDAKDMYKLQVHHKTLNWHNAPNEAPERIKRDYVIGILDPNQPDQPGSGTPTEDQIDELDSDEEIEELDISEVIRVNGVSIMNASQSQDQAGVMRGVNNVLDPSLIRWLWNESVEKRKKLSGRTRGFKKKMIKAIVTMIQDSNLQKEIVTALEREEERERQERRQRQRTST